jgi:hypothetical protein
MRNEAKTCEKFMLFVSQKEAKIMRNGLHFASISLVAKKKFKRKRDTLCRPAHGRVGVCLRLATMYHVRKTTQKPKISLRSGHYETY